MKLTIMRGLPGSGKTTRAEKIMKESGNTFRVNRDKLREMLHFNNWTPKNEKVTLSTEINTVRTILAMGGYNVIVDDTNLAQSHIDLWVTIGKEHNARVELINMNEETTLAQCIDRDAAREKPVGRNVIMDMALRNNLVELGNVVLCDIDGTLADVRHRLEHVKGEKKDWKTFFSLMHLDTPRIEVYEQALKRAKENNAYLILVSARPEMYRKVTEDWLVQHGMTDFVHLLMRPTHDQRPDTEVKKTMYHTFLSNAKVVGVFDDRPSVIRMWRDDLKLDVTDVGEGHEF